MCRDVGPAHRQRVGVNFQPGDLRLGQFLFHADCKAAAGQAELHQAGRAVQRRGELPAAPDDSVDQVVQLGIGDIDAPVDRKGAPAKFQATERIGLGFPRGRRGLGRGRQAGTGCGGHRN